MHDHSAMSPSAMINWLTMAKFSYATAAEKLNAIWIPPPEEVRKESIDYLLELTDLPEESLRQLFESEIARVFQHAQIDAELLESDLFFNAPGAFADHLFWARGLYWTPEQAVALSLNRNPASVNSETLEENGAAGSMFAAEFEARLYLVDQWIRFGLLKEPISPDAFINWLDRTGLSYPANMLAAAEALKFSLTDWHAEYRELSNDYESLEQETEATIFKLQTLEREYAAHILEQAQKIGAQADLIERLEAEISRLQAENPVTETEKPNRSLQKIALGMAMKSYHYDPVGKRNSAVTNIVTAVEAAGLSISDDTVREQLKAAAALLLPQPKSDSKTPK